MKSYLSLLLLGLLACTPPASTENSTAPSSPSQEEVTETVQESEIQQSGSMVYITNEGEKYHTADCRYSKSATPISLNKAKADGKTACGICKPNSRTGEKQLRCSGTTAEGKQCQRMTTDSSAKCFQHRDASE